MTGVRTGDVHAGGVRESSARAGHLAPTRVAVALPSAIMQINCAHQASTAIRPLDGNLS